MLVIFPIALRLYLTQKMFRVWTADVLFFRRVKSKIIMKEVRRITIPNGIEKQAPLFVGDILNIKIIEIIKLCDKLMEFASVLKLFICFFQVIQSSNISRIFFKQKCTFNKCIE